MKINIFTFTRDRIGYTIKCFYSLNKCRELQCFDHYLVDNGSTDGTKEYIASTINNYKGMILGPFNYGLHLAAKMVGTIMDRCDLVIKVDNDCYFPDTTIIQRIASVYEYTINKGMKYILSPRVEGIVKQPRRGNIIPMTIGDSEYHLGCVGQIGGLCMVIPYELFVSLTFNTNLPMARGLDSSICNQGLSLGYSLAYIEDIFVEHYETTNGQAKRYPAYFKRKRCEEVKSFV